MTFTAARQNRIFTQIRDWLHEAFTEWRKAKLSRETVAELQGLTDRELEDIGISRYEIKAAARAAAAKSLR